MIRLASDDLPSPPPAPIDAPSLADLRAVQSALADTLDKTYRDQLALAFVGGSAEDWLPVRRLVEAGWTLARVVELLDAIRDDGVLAERDRAPTILLPYELWKAACEASRVLEGRS